MHPLSLSGRTALLLMLLGGPALADEASLQLKDGPAAVKVGAYCATCHSVDYVLMNSGFLKKAGWDAEVKKMIQKFGAPVPDEDVPALVDYLTHNYGVE
jgi:cytochrome c5